MNGIRNAYMQVVLDACRSHDVSYASGRVYARVYDRKEIGPKVDAVARCLGNILQMLYGLYQHWKDRDVAVVLCPSGH